MSENKIMGDPGPARKKRNSEAAIRGPSGRVHGRDPALRPMPALRGRRPAWVTAAPKAGRGHDFKAPEPPPVNRQRRVIAKLSYVGRGARYAGKVAANAQYLGRREAVERQTPDEGHERYLEREGPFFSARRDGIKAGEVARACKNDPRQFRLIVAPNDGDKIADMKGFVREYMGRIEREVGARLAWAAVVHRADTAAREGNRHAHVIIRGRDLDGQEVRFSRAFVKEGFRHHAEALATERLGRMTDRELAQLREQHERHRERTAHLKTMEREDRSMAERRAWSRERGREQTFS